MPEDPPDEETRAERRAARARPRPQAPAGRRGDRPVRCWWSCSPSSSGTSWSRTPSGPRGRQVVVTVNQGESTDAVIDALSQRRVIGSSLAFQISEVVHGTPTILPGSYALHENIASPSCAAIAGRGTEHLPGRRPRRLHPVRGRYPGGQPARARPGRVRQGGGERRRALGLLPRRARTTSRACSAPATTWSCPGESDQTLVAGHGAALRPRRHRGRAEHASAAQAWA